MAEDIIRVLRIVEFIGPREDVERQVNQSLKDGTHVWPRGGNVTMRIATVGQYPEVLSEGELIEHRGGPLTGNQPQRSGND